MTIADITLVVFTLCNSFRVLAYVPQVMKAANDKDGAKAISLATWSLFLASHLSAAAYASINKGDWMLACVFLANAVGSGAIVFAAANRRRQHSKQQASKSADNVIQLPARRAKAS